jgi:hypothetical protein
LLLVVRPREKYLLLHQFLLKKWRKREVGERQGLRELKWKKFEIKNVFHFYVEAYTLIV